MGDRNQVTYFASSTAAELNVDAIVDVAVVGVGVGDCDCCSVKEEVQLRKLAGSTRRFANGKSDCCLRLPNPLTPTSAIVEGKRSQITCRRRLSLVTPSFGYEAVIAPHCEC